jgi:hypothetical protein
MGQPDEYGVSVESPVEHTELGVVLLLDELVYPGAARSEDEYCCYPAPGEWPSSSNLPVEHACVQLLELYQGASEMMERYEQPVHTLVVH